MEDILVHGTALDRVLLDTDEEEYDTIALQVLAALRKTNLNDQTSLPQVSRQLRLRGPCAFVNDHFQLLDEVDPTLLTIPFIFVLHWLIKHAISLNKSSRSLPQSILPEGNLWPSITRGLLLFDPVQVRYVGSQLRDIVDVVFTGAEQTSNPVPAMQLLRNVILRLDPTSSTLSVTHYQYLKLCLTARAYVDAIDILDRPIYHVPTPESTKVLDKRLGKYRCSIPDSSLVIFTQHTGLAGKITSRIYLEYFLLGAICYLAIEQWTKAKAFLEIVLVHPTQGNSVSLTMVEAFKKWLLVGLLVDGRGTSAPRAMSGPAGKYIRALAKPYDCVVDAFKSHKEERLRGEIQEGLEEWNKDGNYGLMREVYAAFRKFEVIRLSKTFAALPVEQVALRTSPTPQDGQETLLYLSSLIASGELQAQITPSQKGGLGNVRFLPHNASRSSEKDVEEELALKSVELKALLKYITDYDHQLEVNKDYLEFLLKAKRARDQDKKASTNSNSKPIGMPAGPSDIDEDMMDGW